MPLTQGSPLPDVTVNQTSTTSAPDYYTNYLSTLANLGKSQTTTAETTPDKMVAGFTDLQKQALKAAPSTLAAYSTPLQAGEATAADVAKGVGTADINAFMNPYKTAVTDEMARLQQQNIQRNLLPTLNSAFVGTGGTGSQRQLNALGQASGDWQANLLGQQTGALQKGYSDAVNAALQQAQIQNQAAQTQGNLANIEATAGQSALKTGMDLGGVEQALDQAKINAPLTTATNAAQLLRGFTVPTGTSQVYKGPLPGAYAASPLAQIAGLGTLFASGAGGTSAAGGVSNFIKGLMAPTGSNLSFAGTNADGTNVWYDSKSGNYTDSSGNIVPISGSEGE